MVHDEIKKIGLIDADSLLYYCALGSKETVVSLESAIEDLDSRILKMVSMAGCSHYITFVSKGKNNYRHKLATICKYKGNRRKSVLPPVFAGLKAHLEQYPSFICTEFEADDAVGIFNSYYKKEGIETVIFSPDKDVLMQIPGTHYNYGKEELCVTTEDEAAKFIFIQTLMGDSTDGVPGIPRVGIKTAEQILDGVKKEDYPKVCLEAYIQKFGTEAGIYNFAENYNLLNILKSEEDLMRMCSLNIESLYYDLENCIKPVAMVWT